MNAYWMNGTSFTSSGTTTGELSAGGSVTVYFPNKLYVTLIS